VRPLRRVLDDPEGVVCSKGHDVTEGAAAMAADHGHPIRPPDQMASMRGDGPVVAMPLLPKERPIALQRLLADRQMRTISHIGKESNRLEDIEVGLVQELGEVQSEYDDYYRRVFVPLVLPVLREMGVRDTARRTGHSLGAVSAALAGRSRPRSQQLERYEEAASAYASAHVRQVGDLSRPGDALKALRFYLEMSGD
jgi:hypothetical protein